MKTEIQDIISIATGSTVYQNMLTSTNTEIK